MDIRVFHEFIELVMQGSYSAAARALNISQPTLSRHIDALSKELDAQLVADVVPVKLTTEGDAVLQTARQMDDLYNNLRDDLAALRHSQQVHIRIHDALAFKPLAPRIISAASQTTTTLPFVHYEYVPLQPGITPITAIANHACDVSFAQLVEPCDPPVIPTEVAMNLLSYTTSRILFGIPKNSLLAAQDAIHLSELRREPFFMLAQNSYEPLTSSFSTACQARGFRPLIKLLACNLYEEFYLTDHGDGIYVLSENDLVAHSSLRHLIQSKLALVPLAEEDELTVSWYVLHRASSCEALKQFLHLLAANDFRDQDPSTEFSVAV